MLNYIPLLHQSPPPTRHTHLHGRKENFQEETQDWSLKTNKPLLANCSWYISLTYCHNLRETQKTGTLSHDLHIRGGWGRILHMSALCWEQDSLGRSAMKQTGRWRHCPSTSIIANIAAMKIPSHHVFVFLLTWAQSLTHSLPSPSTEQVQNYLLN